MEGIVTLGTRTVYIKRTDIRKIDKVILEGESEGIGGGYGGGGGGSRRKRGR